jgi:hypothetical protein
MAEPATAEPIYPVGTVVRDAKWRSLYVRVAATWPLTWLILSTGDEHGDRVFKGALRDDAHPVRPLTVIPEGEHWTYKPPAGQP